MRRIHSIGFVLCLPLAVVAAGCDQPGSGFLSGQSGDVAEVTASLTTVPSGVLCLKLALSGAASNSLMITVSSGGSSANLSLGSVPPGSLTVTPSAFNVACASVTSSTVPTWVGSAVTVTVVAATPLVVPLTLQPYSGPSVKANFVPFVKSVGAGVNSSYALLSDGTVRAWGYNDYGELGDGSYTGRLTPVTVSGLSGVASLATGGHGMHACAVKSSGSVSCWGYNGLGQLGNGGSTTSNVPVTVSGSYLFRQVSTALYHTCGITTTGGLSCWGSNIYGQFGNGTTNTAYTPTTPSFPAYPESTDEVQCGVAFTCVRSGIQSINCAGDNSYGQLGDGSYSNSSYWQWSSLDTPSALPAGLGLGDYHACEIVMSDGSASCVGDCYGGACTPVPVAGLTGATALAAGNGFTCALKSDGTVWCWGASSYLGQLGDGTAVPRDNAAPVSGLTGVVSIAAGQAHACAAKADGSAWCWGYNSNGQLGDGTTADRALPVKVVF